MCKKKEKKKCYDDIKLKECVKATISRRNLNIVLAFQRRKPAFSIKMLSSYDNLINKIETGTRKLRRNSHLASGHHKA